MMSKAERERLYGLIASLSADLPLPPHIVELMQTQCCCIVDPNGDEMEINLNSAKDATLFRLLNLLEEFARQGKIQWPEEDQEPAKIELTSSLKRRARTAAHLDHLAATLPRLRAVIPMTTATARAAAHTAGGRSESSSILVRTLILESSTTTTTSSCWTYGGPSEEHRQRAPSGHRRYGAPPAQGNEGEASEHAEQTPADGAVPDAGDADVEILVCAHSCRTNGDQNGVNALVDQPTPPSEVCTDRAAH
uniref:NET domain-containing protein n=1 Tax=Oryza brachyantha TaxID=4533 RepID=J3MGN4_ORYBR